MNRSLLVEALAAWVTLYTLVFVIARAARHGWSR